MEDLIKQIAQKFNIAEEQAEQIVDSVLDFVRGKLPPPVLQTLESFVSLDILDETGQKISQMAGEAKDAMAGAMQEAGDAAQAAMGGAKEAAAGAVKQAEQMAGTAAGAADDAVHNVDEAARGFFNRLLGRK